MTAPIDEAALNAARAARRERILRLVRPFQEFGQTEAASGIVIVIAVVLALIAANTPLSSLYLDFIHYHVAIDLGFFHLDTGLQHWVNDGLMVIFFFVVGLEIKREVVAGELAGGRKVWAPVAAAAGGMIVPVLIFFAVVQDPTARDGWAIPMATDIAIAVGVITIVGPRVPTGLKVLLLALAIVDDIGAIAVIAVFYTDDINTTALGLTGGLLVLMYLMNINGIKQVPLYVAVGFVAWMTTHESGVHATILGVVLGLMTPMQAWYRSAALPDLIEALVRRIRQSESEPESEHAHHRRVGDLLTLSDLSQDSISPLDRIEHRLLPWSAFLVVPLFAFTNAGVDLRGGALEEAASSSLALGVGLGLLVGKPIGVTIATYIAVRLGAELPAGVTWLGVFAIGLIAGIGFTVALFVTELSFETEMLLTQAKVGIFVASVLAGVIGLAMLYAASGRISER
jgi:NhaA family Na+:H+ antiporter